MFPTKLQYTTESADPDVARNSKDLEEFENEEYDFAMEVLEMDDIDVSGFTGDINDAELLRDFYTHILVRLRLHNGGALFANICGV